MPLLLQPEITNNYPIYNKPKQTMEHLIQPSPELVERCTEMFESGTPIEAMCRVAAQWGADAELDACLLWLNIHEYDSFVTPELRRTRRPMPPTLTLKEQALERLDAVKNQLAWDHYDPIRLALEALPDDN